MTHPFGTHAPSEAMRNAVGPSQRASDLAHLDAEIARLRSELFNALCREHRTDAHPVLLDKDNAETTLWQAIRNIKIGNRDDDKLIVRELAKLGFGIATIPSEGGFDA